MWSGRCRTVNHSYFFRQQDDVRLRWCVISLPEMQNNTGTFIMVASPQCTERLCVRGSDWLPGSELHSAAQLRDPLAQRESAAWPPASTLPGWEGRWCDVIQYGWPAAATGGLALKSGCHLGPAHYCVVVGAEAQKPGGWPKWWVDVNRCSRWDALPSQCGGGDGAVKTQRERCWGFTAFVHISTALLL